MFRKDPGVFMDILVWEHPGLNKRIFLCNKVYFSNLIIITYADVDSFPIVGWKTSNFALESLKRIFIWYLGKWRKLAVIAHKTVFWIITFLLTWCMYIQNNDITLATSQKYVWRLLTNKLYSLNCRYYSVLCKQSCSQMMVVVLFSMVQNIIPCSYSSPFVPANTSCTPNKCYLFLANSLATVVSEPDLFRLLTFHVPNFMSFFHCLHRTRVSV